MLKPRIIPCLLIRNKDLVKTTKFRTPKYVGDPINTVRIFNEKECDEIIILDIDASVRNKEPNYGQIEILAKECRMPLCYGGGIQSVEQAKKIFSLGVEKIAISSAAIKNIGLVREIAEEVGGQSVVVIIDIIQGRYGQLKACIHNAKMKVQESIRDILKRVQEEGAGEIVLNFVDVDGTQEGYQKDIIRELSNYIEVPLTVLGGASSHMDIADTMKIEGVNGLAVGSLFVFKGPYRAVLVNYPSKEEKSKWFK